MPFTKGGERKRERGPKRAAPLLDDLRWAYAHMGDEAVGTAQQEHFRGMFLRDTIKFTSMLQAEERIEKVRLQKRQAKMAAKAAEEDPGTLQAMESLERWLAELAEQAKGAP
jgi:hypothetical protein